MSAPPFRYRELAALAQGGMATLVRAERDDGVPVVIKRIRPPFDHDPVYRGLFRDEGAVCACLSSSSHIVRLLDRGEDDLGPYLVFEHVDGTDLGVVLDACFRDGRPLELSAFFAVAIPLAEALLVAHEAVGDDGAPIGLVHRDVSPGNVLLSDDGDVKLADFGVAASRLKTEHTIAGEMKGKFAYMAPEQTRGAAVDVRADIFAAGVVLWECLCGRRLFDGPTDADVVHAVRDRESARPKSARADVTDELDELIARMLAKEPAARPSSMREVKDGLESAALALGLERGLRQHASRLARAHPRDAGREHPHVVELRRRTQRVLAAGAAEASRSTTTRWLALLAPVAVVVVALFAVSLSSSVRGDAPQAPAPAVVVEPAASAPAPAPAPVVVEPAQPAPAPAPVVVHAAPHPRPAAKGFGLLFLESEPWANVSVDGAPLGRHTPIVGVRLPAGRRVLKLENPHFHLSRVITVDIPKDGEARRFVDLTKR